MMTQSVTSKANDCDS